MAIYPSASLYPASGIYPGATLPASTIPTWKVEIAWASQLAGLLRFGYSTFQTISGVVQTSDTFADAFTQFFQGAYDDVTNDCDSFRIRRGRDDLLSQINAGTAELVFRRPSDRSYWNPANPDSPLNSANTPGFVPMRPIRVRATDPTTGVVTGQFYGFLRSARYNHETGECRVSAVDLFIFLQRTAVLDPALATTQGGTGTSSYTPDATTDLDAGSAVTTSTSRSGFVRTA